MFRVVEVNGYKIEPFANLIDLDIHWAELKGARLTGVDFTSVVPERNTHP